MKFKPGLYYQNTRGIVMHIIGPVTTFFHGETLLAEEEDGRLYPVGSDEGATVNWHQVSGWSRSTYEANDIPEPSVVKCKQCCDQGETPK